MADNIDIHEAAKADAPALTSAQRIKRALANGKKERISKNASNKIMLGVFRVAAAITTLVLVAIIAYVVINGLPHVSPAFIFTWPHGVNAEGGIWPTIVSTVYVTALAMLICTPIAVLAVQPDVLLMDEPCSAIDPTSVQKVEDLMVELAPEMTIIIVTHNMQQAARISDHTAFFLQEVAGEPATLIEYGQTNDIFTTPMDKRTEDYITGRFG